MTDVFHLIATFPGAGPGPDVVFWTAALLGCAVLFDAVLRGRS